MKIMLDKRKIGILNIIRRIIGGLNSMSMISSQIIMYSPDDVLQKLNNSINHVKQNIQCYCSDPLRDSLVPENGAWIPLLNFLFNLNPNPWSLNYVTFFSDFDALPSDSSLCQQRNKLLPEAVERVLYLFTRSFQYAETIKGYHLLAADGSDVNIAYDPMIEKRFVIWEEANTVNSISTHCMTAWIIYTGIFI